jgi:hypothetical protein
MYGPHDRTFTPEVIEVTVRVEVPLTKQQAVELLACRVGRFDGNLNLSTKAKIRASLTEAVRDEFRTFLREGPLLYVEPYWLDQAKKGVKKLLRPKD